MKNFALFKALQRKQKFRNTNNLFFIPKDHGLTVSEIQLAENYCQERIQKGIKITVPGESDYPISFYRMKEAPLFLEYLGEPVWNQKPTLAVVGSRQLHELSRQWILNELSAFLKDKSVATVSGGALGVDLETHRTTVRQGKSTIVVLPSGLDSIYPEKPLTELVSDFPQQVTLLTEFESHQRIHKSFFYHRNRLIAGLAPLLLVVQCQIKSGTLLTVHHALEMGKPILVVPSHPQILGFEGNQRLLRDGATAIYEHQELSEYWQSELLYESDNLRLMGTNRGII